jgi:hypothetical protein
MLKGLLNAVNQSVLTRTLANIFLFLLLIDALVIASYDIISGHPINTIILSLLSIGAGNALAVLGINHGVTLQPLSTGNTQITQTGGGSNG